MVAPAWTGEASAAVRARSKSGELSLDSAPPFICARDHAIDSIRSSCQAFHLQIRECKTTSNISRKTANGKYSHDFNTEAMQQLLFARH